MLSLNGVNRAALTETEDFVSQVQAVDHRLEALGKRVPGALGRPGDALLILVGHDTNLSNLSGMLHLSWHLPGYQPDDTPPGGALILRARAVSCADPRTDAKRESAHHGRAARRAGRRGCRL